MNVELCTIGGKTVVKAGGRIDSACASEFADRLAEAAQAVGEGELTIDLGSVSYISSSGLRALLKLRKTRGEEIRLVEVVPQVYDVLEMTGFTSMFRVRKQLRELSLEGCQELGHGVTGRVFRVDDETVLKLFGPDYSVDDVEKERTLARAALLSGLPTAISYETVRSGNCYGTLFELVKASNVSQLVSDAPEKARQMGERMGLLLKEIHATEPATKDIPAAKTLYDTHLSLATEYLTADEVETLKWAVGQVPDVRRMVHGDFHPKNVMDQQGEWLLIDMSDVCYGHPVFDWAQTYLVCVLMDETEAGSAQDVIGLTGEPLRQLWEGLVEAYYGEPLSAGRAQVMRAYCLLHIITMPTYHWGSRQIFLPIMDRLRRHIPFIKETAARFDELWQ